MEDALTDLVRDINKLRQELTESREAGQRVYICILFPT